MRFFVALEIPPESRKELTGVQKELKNLVPEAKLTNPEKLHLTIAFIGEQPDHFREKLIEIMQKASENIPPFTVIPSYIDGFPHLHTANTLWVGVKEDIDKLYELRHHIKDGLVSLGLPVDQRRFVPHIAIAKLDHFKLIPEIEEKLDQVMKKEFSPIQVPSVKLFQSIPEHGFHTYNTLAQIQLSPI